MQFTTKSEFQNDGRLYITDDDNGIKDTVFGEILGFQPTMGWMYARGQEVALFVDDRYYEGVSKRLNEREIASEKFGNIKVTVYNTKEKIHRILEVFEMLKKNQGTAQVRVPTGLVVGQIQEMYEALRDPKLKGFSLNFESQASAQVVDTARNIVSSSQESSVHQKQKNIFITDHKAGMRDDHFLYYLGIDPEFGCMSIYKSEMVLVLPQSLKSTVFDESFIAARLEIKKISLKVSYVADRKNLVTTALSGLKKEQISLSPLMTFDQLLEVVTSAGNNTLCMNRGDFDVKRHEKQDDEIEDHKNAIQIIETVFEALEYMNKAGWLYGKREKDVVAIIQKLIEKLGGIGEAFPSIVSVGPNGAVPHHIPTQTVPGDDMVVDGPVLFDIGAVATGGRRSDFTRVLYVGKQVGQRFEDFTLVEDLVYDIHMYALSIAREGITVGELDEKTRAFSLEKSKEKTVEWESIFDHFKYDSKLSFDEKMKKILYSHGLGHGVGIRIHEFPYFSKHKDAKLTQGMFITIEPGVYIPGYFGVRLENLYYVGKDGKLVTDNRLPLKLSDRQKNPPTRERERELQKLLYG